MRLLLVVSLMFLGVYSVPFSYDGYVVYRITIKNEEQYIALIELSDNPHVDFWSHLGYNGRPIDVMVYSSTEFSFKSMLQNYNIEHEILIDNVEKIVQLEKLLQTQAPTQPKGKINFTRYNKLDDIYAYLTQLQKTYPKLVTVKTIGKSFERRNLRIVQISTNKTACQPIIFIDAGMHAREWISPAMALYIIFQLVENPENKNLLDRVEWHILPIVNPDGYEYSYTTERFWKKTRSPHEGCVGTDLNRNFGFHWGEGDNNTNPCSDTYKGPAEFSEIEARHFKTYIESQKEDIKLYLSLHSFGRYIFYPWGYTVELPDDEEELFELAAKVNNAISQEGGKKYIIGSYSEILYPAAGGSSDWVKGVAGIELAYTIELPKEGSNGFDPFPNDILQTVRTAFTGIRAYGYYIAERFGQKEEVYYAHRYRINKYKKKF